MRKETRQVYVAYVALIILTLALTSMFQLQGDKIIEKELKVFDMRPISNIARVGYDNL